MIRASQVWVPESPTRVKWGSSVALAVWIWSKMISVSKRRACFSKAGHQIRTHDAVGVGGPVVHVGGGHQLAALGQAGDQDGLEVGAGGMDRGGVAGRAGTENEQAMMARGLGHDFSVVDRRIPTTPGGNFLAALCCFSN